MIKYQELIEEHQALQRQLADQPDAVDVQQVRRLVAQAQDAGEYVGDPQRREQLRAILRHWGAFVHERTGDLLPTQLVPYASPGEPEEDLGRRLPIPEMWASSLWWLGGFVVVVAIVTVLATRGAILERTPTETPIASLIPTSAEPATPTSAPQTTVQLKPALVDLMVGETSTVSICVDSVRRLNSVRLELVFDPTYVQVEDADAKSEGVQIAPGGMFEPEEVVLNQVTVDEDGRIIYQATRESRTGLDGSDVIASIVLRGALDGGSKLHFESVALFDSDGNTVEAPEPSDGLISVTAMEAISSPTPTFTQTVTPTVARTPEATPPVTIDARGDVVTYTSGSPVEAPPAGVDIRVASVGPDRQVVLQPTEGAGVPEELAGWAGEEEILLWISLYEPVSDRPPYMEWLFVLDLDREMDTGRPAGAVRISPDLGYEAAVGVAYDPESGSYEPFFLVWDREQGGLVSGPELPRWTVDEARTTIGFALSLETLRQSVTETTGVTLVPDAVKGRAAALAYEGEKRVIDFYPDLPE